MLQHVVFGDRAFCIAMENHDNYTTLVIIAIPTNETFISFDIFIFPCLPDADGEYVRETRYGGPFY